MRVLFRMDPFQTEGNRSDSEKIRVPKLSKEIQEKECLLSGCAVLSL